MKGGDLEITVAGVPKAKGAAILKADGGIEAFRFGYVFKGSGHEPCEYYNRKKDRTEIITGTGKTGAVYHDQIDEDKTVDGNVVHITRNVAIIEVDYSMDEWPSYYQVRMQFQNYLDQFEKTDYNKKW